MVNVNKRQNNLGTKVTSDLLVAALGDGIAEVTPDSEMLPFVQLHQLTNL
jgi:hypothetical protein